ncbi:MAG: zf-HC2 domain-containing protein [Actinomycetota bacterium]|nr:zf-HC2 domain-containing protein [Actinomycetota bacterium]
MSSRNAEKSHVGADLSALLDRELDVERAETVRSHVSECARCRRELEEITRVRRALRTAPAAEVPDLVGPILERLPAARGRGMTNREWRIRLRIAAVAAAVTAVSLVGVWLPGPNEPSQTALATTVVEEVRAGARSLDTYRATFSIVERGWHETVDQRRFSAEVNFKAPQSFGLSIADHTDYPAGDWPANDVELVANPRAWWISEPSSCPPTALPGCLGEGVDREERRLLNRRPFDGTIALPTDLVLPLQTLADNGGFDVERAGTIQGRPTLHITLPLREAMPLVSSLQTGGSWRTFYGDDRVDLWLDEATSFPLRFEVRADGSSARRAWARAEGYDDRDGELLLEVRATDFSEPSRFAPETFWVPDRGTTADARFEARSFDRLADGLAPTETFGLRPFRAGRSGDQTVLSYSEGMTWLKVTHDRARTRSVDPTSEEISLGAGRWAYYQPATSARGRSVELLGKNERVLVESNLPRAQLFDVATSIDVAGHKATPRSGKRLGLAITRVDLADLEGLGFVRLPGFLPEGYRAAAAYTSRTPAGARSATVLYRRPEAEYDALGIRLKQSEDVDLLLPSPEDAVHVVRDGLRMRWFPRRGEIDWVDDGVYTSLSAPSLSRATLVEIAVSLQ